MWGHPTVDGALNKRFQQCYGLQVYVIAEDSKWNSKGQWVRGDRCLPGVPLHPHQEASGKIPGNESARGGNADMGKGVMGLAGLNPECTSLPRPQCAVCTPVWCGEACVVKQARSENSLIGFSPGAGLLRNKKLRMCLLIFIKETGWINQKHMRPLPIGVNWNRGNCKTERKAVKWDGLREQQWLFWIYVFV